MTKRSTVTFDDHDQEAIASASNPDRALERGYQGLADLWPEVHDAAETRERRRRYAQRVDRAADA